MANDPKATPTRTKRACDALGRVLRLPKPTLHFRRRSWLAFQRALDPLAPPKPLPRRRSSSG